MRAHDARDIGLGAACPGGGRFDTSDPGGTAARLRHFLPRLLGRAGEDWTLRLVARSRTRGGVLVFEGRERAGRPGFAIKVFRQPRFATPEYDATLEASQSGARVARPIRCDPRSGLVVTEWIEGGSLRDALRRGEGTAVLVRAGRWLRAFHRGTRRPAFYQPLAALIPVADAGAAASLEMSPRDRIALRAQVAALTGRAAALSPGIEWRMRLHGDFHPGNLLLPPEGPVGIDLGDSRLGSPIEDLARMTVQLDLLAASDTGALGCDPRDARAGLLEGYRLGRLGHRRLALAEWGELLRRWQLACRTGAPRPDRVEAVRAVLGRRGWLVAAIALLGEPAPLASTDTRGTSSGQVQTT